MASAGSSATSTISCATSPTPASRRRSSPARRRRIMARMRSTRRSRSGPSPIGRSRCAGRRGTTVIDRSTAYPLFGLRAGRLAWELVRDGKIDIVHGLGASVLGYARRRATSVAPLVLNPQGLEEFGATNPRPREAQARRLPAAAARRPHLREGGRSDHRYRPRARTRRPPASPRARGTRSRHSERARSALARPPRHATPTARACGSPPASDATISCC